MSLRYKDKVAIITGGARGIGEGIAREFVAQGSKVVIADLLDNLGQPLVDSLNTSGPGEAFFVKCDVSVEQNVKDLIKITVEKFQQIDCVVNNAMAGLRKDIDSTTNEEFTHMWKTNVLAPFNMCKYSLPYLRKTEGNIINIGSVIGEQGADGFLVYGSTKAALLGMSKSLAIEEGPNNVRVNVVTPGWIQTPYNIMAKPDTISLEEHIKHVAVGSVLNKVGQPEDIAKACMWLAAEAPFTTGTSIHCTGGSQLGSGRK